MSGCWSSDGAGRVRASEGDIKVVPFGWRYAGERYPAIWNHGAGGTYQYGPIERLLWDKLLCPAVSTDGLGQRTWGADSVVGVAGSIEAERVWAVNNLGAKPGKLIAIGGSMGGLSALLYTLANPSKVAALLMFIPAFDPEFVRNNDPNGTQLNKTAIEAAYGANPVPAGKQGFTRGADLAATGVPAKLFYSTTDTFTPLASTQEFISDSGCESTSLGAVGHGYNNVDVDEAAEFLYDHRS